MDFHLFLQTLREPQKKRKEKSPITSHRLSYYFIDPCFREHSTPYQTNTYGCDLYARYGYYWSYLSRSRKKR
jgi:hypothetical protein